MKAKSRFKHILNNLIIISIALLFLIVAIEIYLRITKPCFLKPNFSITGNFTDFTSRKYLTKEVFNKKDDIFRIVGLGDSFAVNFIRLSLNYHDFLEQNLVSVYGLEKIEVINAGMECTGPGYYFYVLEKYGDLMKPDLVLVSFFIGNDFKEMFFKRKRIGVYIWEDVEKNILSYLKFENFWLFQVLRSRLIKFFDSLLKNNEIKEKEVVGEGYFAEENFLRIEKSRAWVYEKERENELLGLWSNSSKVLLDIKKWCDERNINLVIAVLPDQFQVEEDLRQKMIEKYDLKKDSLDIFYPNKVLSDFFIKHSIYYVDLLRDFQRKSQTSKLYLTRDTHWNEEGNKLAAEIIASYIKEKVLIKEAQD